MRVLALKRLQNEILQMQGLPPTDDKVIDFALGPLRHAFPNSSFPTGAIHEFITENKESSAATGGFVAGLLTSLIKKRGAIVWISSSRKLFPPALKSFGIDPDQLVFVDLKNEKDVIWAMDEALKCDALSAVVAEMQNLDFTESRRMQLAVERSRVTGFVLRLPASPSRSPLRQSEAGRQGTNPRKINTTACVSRWKISSIASEPIDGMPGVGFPQWKVELLRIRNGKPGSWEIKWEDGKFHAVDKPIEIISEEKPGGDVRLKVG
jgi:protein ImuA